LVPSCISSAAAFTSLCQRDRMISSSRSILYRFLILYGSLYAGFGVQSPYLPILLDNRHLRPETIGLALAAGMAMRLMAAQAVARPAARFGAARPAHRTVRDRRNRLAKRGAACCRGTHATWRSTTIGDRWPRPGHAEPGSRGRSVVAAVALSQDGVARNVDTGESCNARLLCDDPLEQSRNQSRHVWHLVV